MADHHTRPSDAPPAGAGGAAAGALLRAVSASQGWTPATQGCVLLDFIDALIADDPAVAGRFRAHLDGIAADAEAGEVDVGPADGEAEDPEEMTCRECGAPMWTDASGVSHHWGTGMDDIDHARDRDHVAVADEEG